MRRVAVTGIGLLTALGAGREAVWEALLAGRSAVGRIQDYQPASFRTQLAAEIPDLRPERWSSRRALRMTTRNDQLAIAGAALAVADAGIELAACDLDRAGLFIGGNKEISNPEHLLQGCLVARQDDGRADLKLLGERAATAFYPLYYVEGLQSAALFHVSAAHGLRGANAYFHGTADAGATAIGRAFRSIARGESDLAVAGGSDDATSWWAMSKLDGLQVLTGANERGAQAFRPYDLERSGSVLGEGAAYLVLEEASAARRRGARIYAEISGVGRTQDGARLLTPEPDGEPLAAAVRQALDDAHLVPEDIGYVATHGCATWSGDRSEAKALQRVFGSAGTVASSIKPATGHLVAGAGALNAAVCALALFEAAVPPTLNLDAMDPACAFDWVPGQARQLQPQHAMALARGLHGQQVALALSAAP